MDPSLAPGAEEVRKAEEHFMQWLQDYKPNEQERAAISKASRYPMFGGLAGSLTASLLSNKYFTKKVPNLGQKIIVNLFSGTVGFMIGTYVGAMKGAKVFFATPNSPITNEYRRVIQLRQKYGMKVPGFVLKGLAQQPGGSSTSSVYEGDNEAPIGPEFVPDTSSDYDPDRETTTDSNFRSSFDINDDNNGGTSGSKSAWDQIRQKHGREQRDPNYPPPRTRPSKSTSKSNQGLDSDNVDGQEDPFDTKYGTSPNDGQEVAFETRRNNK